MTYNKKTPLCQTPTEAYIITYPEAIEFARMQFAIQWPETEFPVEDDLLDMKTKLTDGELNALTYGLKLFTHYELKAGDSYWGSRIMRKYPRPCIQRMANSFSHAELNMHAPFYAKVNEVLHLDTEEFYTSYKEDEVLSSRMKFIGDILSGDDDPYSVAVFSMVEGAVLYSFFAFLKHFRANGKNLMKNLVSGIDASVKDENIHALGGAWLFRQHISELGLKPEDYEDKLYKAAEVIYEHERRIIEKIFSFGSIQGITEKQLKAFVKSRLNECLSNLGLKPLFKINYNPIARWFYENINAVKVHDFFSTQGAEYHNNWKKERFTW